MTGTENEFTTLEHAAALLAQADRLSSERPRALPAWAGTSAIVEWLRAACLACGDAGSEADKAAEWLLDNDYVVHRALRQVKTSLPVGFYRTLPATEQEEGDRFPRVFLLAHRFLQLSHMQVSPQALRRFLNAYQKERSLRIGELWAFPAMLRIACIEILVSTLSSLLCDDLDLPVQTTHWSREAHELEANERVARAIANLSTIDAISWEDFFDDVSIVERILRSEPSGFYQRMDFPSRDQYRRAVEALSQCSNMSEIGIARRAVRASGEAPSGRPQNHVGYWLVGDGSEQFERLIGAELPLLRRLEQTVRAHPGAFYFSSLGLLMSGALLLPALYLWAVGAGAAGWLAGMAVSIIPASVVAMTLLHWTITRLLPPRVLYKIDCSAGLPDDCQTLIAVPVVIAGSVEVPALVEQLENHWLSNSDPMLEIVLLADLADASSKHTAADEAIERELEAGIRRLNSRYGTEDRAPFHLLLRPRLHNPKQECWMAWERKRGKLEQLNRLLLDGDQSPFTRHVGTHALPAGTRFVIPLDADTTLPPGVMPRMVGTLAHPLNQAQFDEKTGEVTAGYTIVQPRVEISPQSGSRTLFARLFAGDTAIDIYSRAVSNIYQDLFGAGIFVGKGIYDVRGFQQSIAGRVPENAILSHDLFEGAHGRAALASDIVLYEGFPNNYLEYARRTHRWIRGDWQLLPWLKRRVRLPGGTKDRNPIVGIDRWKIIDNLRRSLVAPATILLAVSGWIVLPGQAWFWSLLAFFMPAGQLVTDLIGGLARGRRRGTARSLYPQIRDQAGRWILALIFLLNDALIAVHAIAVTLWRILISRKRLLEWTSAAHSATRFADGQGRRTIWQNMWLGPAIAASLAIALAFARSEAILAALPLFSLWVLAPEIALTLARERQDRTEPLAEDDRRFLRRLARRTWLFFETFAGPEDNWLPPDNYQGTPHEEIAQRTSPTNIGMLLLSTAAAWDLGYIGRTELAARTANLFATLGRLERFRGHFYNWYDTRTLMPLEPRYLSTVDSGNLAASLVAFAAALRAASEDEKFELQRWDGLLDVVDLIDEVSSASDSAAIGDAAQRVRDRINDARPSPAIWANALQSISQTDIPALVSAQTAVEENHRRSDRGHSDDMRVLIDRLDYQACSMLRDLQNGIKTLREMDSLSDEALLFAYSMEFAPLYDEHRRLFRIGLNVSTGRPDTHHYDLLASEARLASFFAIAKGDVPPEHWFHLGRPMKRLLDGAALLSWNGSMFEYLMPRLLLKAGPSTLLGESERLAVEVQREYSQRHRVPWGISESAFAARDPEHRYRYQGFGVPSLGLKRGLGDDMVVAPYAAALALAVTPREAAENLRQLAQAGASGRYGLIEALDYTGERISPGTFTAVNAYMAHHQGMLLCGIVNALFDDRFVLRFTEDARMRPIVLLLSERVPREIPPEIERLNDRGAAPSRGIPQSPPASWEPRRDALRPQMHFLGNGPFSTWISDSGSGGMRWHHRALTRMGADGVRDADGYWIYIADEDNADLWSATLQPTDAQPDEYAVTCHPHLAEYRSRNHGIASRLEVGVLAGVEIDVRRLRLINETPRPRTLRVTTYSEIVLADPLEDERHPAFSKLFVGSEYLRELGGLLFHRRARAPHETPPVLLHFAVDAQGPVPDLLYTSDRSEFIARNGNLRSPRGAVQRLRKRVGWTHDPIMSLQHEMALEPFETREICFLTVAAATRDTAIEIAERHSTLEAIEWGLHSALSDSSRVIAETAIDPGSLPELQQIASTLLYPPTLPSAQRTARLQNHLGQADLWGIGLSGDLPILLLRSGGEASTLLPSLLAAHRLWRRHGLEIDLVILQDAGSAYIEPVLDQLRARLRDAGMAELLGRKGGVHIVFSDQVGAERARLLASAARMILDDKQASLREHLAGMRQTRSPLPLLSATRASGFDPVGPSEVRPDLEFDNGLGGFDIEKGEYVIPYRAGGPTPAPWCNILANPDFGTLVSEAGGGYTWSINSGENRLTTWSNDPVSDRPSETLYLRDEETGQVWTVTPAPVGLASACEIRHGMGYTTWAKCSVGVEQRMEVSVPADAPVKIIRLRLRNLEHRHRRLTATYYAEWLLGSLPSIARPHVVCDYDIESQSLTAVNHWTADFSQRVAFLASSRAPHGFTTDRMEFLGQRGDQSAPAALRRWGLSGELCAGGETCAAYQVHFDLGPGEQDEIIFVLGQGRDQNHARALARHWTRADHVDTAFVDVRRYWEDILQAVQVSTPDPAFDVMANRWFLYQALSSRIFARSGFYQSSGAFGFRDQLQDVLAIMHAAPALAREHILESARHQFVEGDVLHWWHPPSDRGVRTRFSDDLLWLPYVVSAYVEATGDNDILDEKVDFLGGAPLEADEHTRYAQFVTSGISGSLFEHCERALEHASTSGAHGLPLIGAGDWNDGMDRLGQKGNGESLWLAWFQTVTATRFAAMCDASGRPGSAHRWAARAADMRQSAERSGWDGAWYLRAFDDEGRAVGSATSDECRIDSIAQSWAAFANADPDRTKQALQSAWNALVSQDDALARLLHPPFDRGFIDPGYIKAYPPGVRENGGHYSHAAAWLAMAFAKLDDPERASKIFDMINPVRRTEDRRSAEEYRLEPYAVAGDITAAGPRSGRGGWSWYTGAAGWAWQLAVRSMLGLRQTSKCLVIAPCIPPSWGGYRAVLRVGAGEILVAVEDPDGLGCGDVSLTINGEPHDEDAVPLPQGNEKIDVVARIVRRDAFADAAS
jgi:cyclic beta-1,2-glucan synthetase